MRNLYSSPISGFVTEGQRQGLSISGEESGGFIAHMRNAELPPFTIRQEKETRHVNA